MKELKQQLKELKDSGATKREITDAMLEIDCNIRDLGKGCLEEAIREAKQQSMVIYKTIAEVDSELGKILILNIDM